MDQNGSKNDEDELEQLLHEKWTNNHRKRYVTVKNCTLPERYLQLQEAIDNFEVFDTDVWICSYPRTGTTWMSEMAWMIANNLDYEKAKSPMFGRIRFLDLSFLVAFEKNAPVDDAESVSDSINYTKNQSNPRFIKTHLPYSLLPKQIQNGQRKPKIIYICRNPLDACVSYYYHSASIIFTGTIEEFCKLFLSKKIVYGSYWDHVLSFWQLRQQPNVLFLKYEDMKNNLPNVIQNTTTFLGKSISDEEIRTLQQHLSFESMKNNPSVNGGKTMEFVKKSGSIKAPFIRSGIVGGYKAEMPLNYVELFQNWMKKHLEGTGLNFTLK